MKQNKNVRKRALALLIALSAAVAGCAPEKVKEQPEPLIPEEKHIAELTEPLALPRVYSYTGEEIPVLRDQQETNNCWAFASLSALEASKDNTGREIYSPDHLIYNNPFQREFSEGGSYLVTMAYLLSWMGPVREADDPFDKKPTEGAQICAHVQEIRLSEGKDYETIKRFVYLYGGVETAVYVDFEEDVKNSSYYNADTYSYCYLGAEASNHDIVIIGWDDDYPAENFAGDVAGNGAFLCRNSWGEEFGQEGSFWVSYEDVNIGETAVVYSRIDATDNYDRIYQSDLCGFTAQAGYREENVWFANVYTAAEDISVRAAGFYATRKNTEYELYIVPDFQDEDSFGGKQFLTNGYLDDAGYYTVDFPQAVPITAGTDFAVIAKVKTEGAEYPAAVECRVEDFSENADLGDGRGYLSLHGGQWENVEETKNFNICLKAYADLKR